MEELDLKRKPTEKIDNINCMERTSRRSFFDAWRGGGEGFQREKRENRLSPTQYMTASL